VQLRNEHGIKASDVERIELRVHSLVLELTGKKTPRDGLEAKFSVYHSAAAGLIFGEAGEHQYDDAIVNRADVLDLRGRIVASVDDDIHEASVDATVHCKDGRVVHVFVKHAIGSMENPMTDARLEGKFDSLVNPILGGDKAEKLKKLCWDLARHENVNVLVAEAKLD
jgi:2-methylcitrate dehydratase PrpD